MTYLWNRLIEAKKTLKPYQSKYRVAFEDPAEPEAPLKILVPDPNWMAAALAGGVLSPIEAYLEDQATIETYEKKHGSMKGFSWNDHEAKHPYANPIGPMIEEEAIEYLIMKDIPPRVWRDYQGNRQILKIVPVEFIPADRTYRNAWIINQEIAA